MQVFTLLSLIVCIISVAIIVYLYNKSVWLYESSVAISEQTQTRISSALSDIEILLNKQREASMYSLSVMMHKEIDGLDKTDPEYVQKVNKFDKLLTDIAGNKYATNNEKFNADLLKDELQTKFPVEFKEYCKFKKINPRADIENMTGNK